MSLIKGETGRKEKGRKRVEVFRKRGGNVCKHDGGRITYVKARVMRQKEKGVGESLEVKHRKRVREREREREKWIERRKKVYFHKNSRSLPDQSRCA